MNGDYPTCSKDAVERDFATLRQSYNLGLPMRWKETRKDEDLEISEDGQEVRCAGGHDDMRFTKEISLYGDHPIDSDRGLYFYEVQVIKKDRPRNIYGIRHLALGFAYKNSSAGSSSSDLRWTSKHTEDGALQADRHHYKNIHKEFSAGDTVGCGIDFVHGFYFHTVNGLFVGSIPADEMEVNSIYPSVMLYGHLSTHLCTNFGSKPYRTITDGLLEDLARERLAYQENTRRLPMISGGQTVVRAVENERTFSSSDQKSWKRGITTNFPIPVSTNFFYFEVKIIRQDGSIAVGCVSGHERLLDLPVGRNNSWIWDGHDGKFHGPYQTDHTVSFQAGDIVGCGLDRVTSQMFYTKNGNYLGIVFQHVGKSPTFSLYPVALFSDGASGCLEMNFGQSPFVYDIPSHLVRASASKAAAGIIAASLPPETIYRILLLLLSTPSNQDLLFLQHKRTVGLCRLTCRYWNRVCRPLLFANLALRTTEDLTPMLEFMTPPVDPISKYIRNLTIRDGRHELWSHMALLRLCNRLPQLETLCVVGRATIDRPEQTYRDHQLRPPFLSNRLIATFCGFQSIWRLRLTSFHFSSFHDVAQILSSLHKLKTFTANILTWSRQVSSPLPRLPCHIDNLTVSYCSDPVPFLNLLRMLQGSAGRDPDQVVEDEEAIVIRDISQIVVVDHSSRFHFQVVDNPTHLHLTSGDYELSIRGQQHDGCKSNLAFQMDKYTADSDVRRVSAVYITVELDIARRTDWKRVDELLSSLRGLSGKSVTVEVVVLDDHMAPHSYFVAAPDVVSDIEGLMSRLRMSQKLVVQLQGGEWTMRPEMINYKKSIVSRKGSESAGQEVASGEAQSQETQPGEDNAVAGNM